MRYLLPAVAAAAALATGAVPAAATDSHHHQRSERAASHVSLHVSRHALLRGEKLVVRGRVNPAGARRVKLVVRGRDGAVIATRTDVRGRFRAAWSPDLSGSYAVRAYGIHDARSRGAASPARRLTAYRYAGASYYGPGLYGNGVACGGTLMPGTLGVANKTLPCGTRVKLRYHGRTVTVPVIDRGPYVAGRDYDLTEATKERLGFPGVGTVLASR
ncbi:MAG TPA: septal ring lytic transglycosylase RlpA family protein [Solirubrobacterales bacterium]|nr:septal ring lytic transglycosylase RlpA family protein [Solirubrobacterales bacterium]